MYRQVEFWNGASRLICWVEYDGRLKPGMMIELKGIPDVMWRLKHIYKPILTTPPRSVWEVGGL
jgi:hypothetical protein